jgi:ribosomal protein S18 acetylase RimI-like enzyme
VTEVLIRRAGVDDAERIAEVHISSWRSAYRGLIPDTVLDGLSVEERAAMWRRWMSEEAPPIVWMAEDEEEVVGFVAAGPQDPPDEGVGEIYAIYLVPDHAGRGLGRALLDRAVDDLRAGGLHEAVLWVLARNRPARRFYERAGWRTDGATKTEPIGDVAELEQVRYRLSL